MPTDWFFTYLLGSAALGLFLLYEACAEALERRREITLVSRQKNNAAWMKEKDAIHAARKKKKETPQSKSYKKEMFIPKELPDSYWHPAWRGQSKPQNQ